MARQKATISLDRKKLELARSLVRARSVSETVDVALDRLIELERLRHDVAAYRRVPPSAAEISVGELPVAFDLDDEDVDYEALYGRSK